VSSAVRPRTEQRNAVGPAGADHRAFAGNGGAQPPLACVVPAARTVSPAVRPRGCGRL